MLKDVVIHSIGSHPVTFGKFPSIVPHRFYHLEDVGMCGINMPLVFILKARESKPDTHLVHAIRKINQIPATIEVLSALNQLGFDNLRALIYDKRDLWNDEENISLACLGSICVIDGKNMGIVFHISSTRTDIEYFSARNGQKSLPEKWIYPSIMRVA